MKKENSQNSVDIIEHMLYNEGNNKIIVTKGRQKMKVTKESIIGDVLDYDIGTAEFFLNIGMHCLGCPASRGESIEQACAVHGTDCDELVKKINEYLESKA